MTVVNLGIKKVFYNTFTSFLFQINLTVAIVYTITNSTFAPKPLAPLFWKKKENFFFLILQAFLNLYVKFKIDKTNSTVSKNSLKNV